MRQPLPPTRPKQAPDEIRKLLATLWEQNLPLLRDRCAQLEQAVDAARANCLTHELREQTISTAHKLAGSLGMFGYSEGTEHARHIEQHLTSSAPIDSALLAEEVAALKSAAAL